MDTKRLINPSDLLWLDGDCNVEKDILLRKVFERRNIILSGKVNEDTLEKFTLQMTCLISQSAEPINVYIINGCGGDLVSGLAIYDQIQTYAYLINIYGIGIVKDIHAVILAGGMRKRRFILPNSQLILTESLVAGKTSSERVDAQHRSHVLDILAQNTECNVTEIINHGAITGQEAVKYGFCDSTKLPMYEYKEMDDYNEYYM